MTVCYKVVYFKADFMSIQNFYRNSLLDPPGINMIYGGIIYIIILCKAITQNTPANYSNLLRLNKANISVKN